MIAFSMQTPAEIVRDTAIRMKRRRIEASLTQRDLASRAGVPYGTLRLYEETGKGSFETVVKIAFALEAEEEFTHLFPSRPPLSIEDVVEKPERRRVRKR